MLGIQTASGVVLTMTLWSSVAFSQSIIVSNSPLEFEAASIRPSGPKSIRGWDGGPGRPDATRYTYGLATLLDLILEAYNVNLFQVSSAKALDRKAFDLIATLPSGASKEDLRAMLQHLLKERFGLTIHVVSKEFRTAQLVIAKTGLKLDEVAPGQGSGAVVSSASSNDGWPKFVPNTSRIVSQGTLSNGYIIVRVRAQLEPLARLAGILSDPAGPSVIDSTGTTAKYSFALEYAKEIDGVFPGAPPPALDLAGALQKLGLQIVSVTSAFDVIIVDSFSEMPTDN